MTNIYIPALIIDGREILHPFGISTDLGGYGLTLISIFQKAPTLAELRHAYETNPQINESVDKSRKSEWTASFLLNGRKLINRPVELYIQGRWQVNGGTVYDVELPPKGWILEYDKITGLPKKTTKSKMEARDAFGDHTSHFDYESNGLFAIRRRAGWFRGGGEFNIDGLWTPSFQREDTGYRKVVYSTLRSKTT